MQVEIFSDVACPWCYIGEARFRHALAGFSGAQDVEVVFRPYQLDPAAPNEAVPMLEYLERRFGARVLAMVERVKENAREEGLTIDYDRGLTANTLDAHRLLWLADQHGPGVQQAVATGLFRAHFSEGRDIGDPGVLTEIAAGAGMDAARVREQLASGEGTREVGDQIEHAREMGITAVPTFVIAGKYAIQGAQPPTAFLRALETVAIEERKPTDDPADEAGNDG